MSERPILFNGEMVRAILDGRKTQTRRVIKPQPATNNVDFLDMVMGESSQLFWEWDSRVNVVGRSFLCPYGKPGDRLWVREAHGLLCDLCLDSPCEYPEQNPCKNIYVQYRAESDDPYPGQWPAEEARGNPGAPKWRPSIHMPRWASRITLEVVAVRVERVQEISPLDATRESCFAFMRYGPPIMGGIPTLLESRSPIEQFSRLWDSINAKRGFSWESNPWVWVVEFEVVE